MIVDLEKLEAMIWARVGVSMWRVLVWAEDHGGYVFTHTIDRRLQVQDAAGRLCPSEDPAAFADRLVTEWSLAEGDLWG